MPITLTITGLPDEAMKTLPGELRRPGESIAVEGKIRKVASQLGPDGGRVEVQLGDTNIAIGRPKADDIESQLLS